jgi:hypothetical protein
MYKTMLMPRPMKPTTVSTRRAHGVRACQSNSSPFLRLSAHMRRQMANVAPTRTDCAWVSVPK